MVYKYLLIECLIMLSRQLNCQFRTAIWANKKIVNKKKYPIRRRYAPISDIWPDLLDSLLALNSALTIVVSVPAACLSIHWYSLFIHKTDKWRFNYFVYRRDMLSSAFLLDKAHFFLAFPLYLKLDPSSLAASTSQSLYKSKYSTYLGTFLFG